MTLGCGSGCGGRGQKEAADVSGRYCTRRLVMVMMMMVVMVIGGDDDNGGNGGNYGDGCDDADASERDSTRCPSNILSGQINIPRQNFLILKEC